MIIQNFSEIVTNYKTLFFDIWGVVHDGVEAYSGVVDHINQLTETHDVYFLSNAPRSSSAIGNMLRQRFNIKVTDDQIMTSGDQTALYFQQNPNLKAYFMGFEPDLKISSRNLTQNIAEATHILCTLYHQEGDNLQQYNEFFKYAIQHSVKFICTNPDTIVMQGKTLRYCAGYFASIYANLGGEVLLQGKPDIAIYNSLSSRIADFSKKETLMIGDTVGTDIGGANIFGIDSALVLTGNAGREMHEIGFSNFIKSLEYFPSYILHGAFK